MNPHIKIIEHKNWSVDMMCGEEKVHFPPTEAEEKKVLSQIEKWMQPKDCRLGDDDVVTLCVMHNTRMDEFHFLIHDDYNNGLFLTSYAEMNDVGVEDYGLTLANIRYDWNKKFKECIEYIQKHANNHYNEGHVRLWKSCEALMEIMALWNISDDAGMDISMRKSVQEWDAMVKMLTILPLSMLSMDEVRAAIMRGILCDSKKEFQEEILLL